MLSALYVFARPPVSPSLLSVRLSVTRVEPVDQSKTFDVRIIQLSPQLPQVAAWLWFPHG